MAVSTLPLRCLSLVFWLGFGFAPYSAHAETAGFQTTQLVAPSPATPSDALTIGRWRLIRTPSPTGRLEAVSITRPGELSGSDPNFVGLMIRCAEPDLEVLLVMLQPLPPRAHPTIIIDGTKVDGRVVPPGMIQLPPDFAKVAKDVWPKRPNLRFSIEEDSVTTKGLVLLDDLDRALDVLTGACPTR